MDFFFVFATCYVTVFVFVLVRISGLVSCDIIIFLALSNEARPPCDLDPGEEGVGTPGKSIKNMEFDEDLEAAKKVVTKVKDELGEQVERNLSKIGKINLRSHSE